MKVLWGVETRTFAFCYNLTIILGKLKIAILPEIWQLKEANYKKYGREYNVVEQFQVISPKTHTKTKYNWKTLN